MAPPDLQRGFECTDVERFSDAYVDGEFEAPERALFEQHLGECGGCRIELQRVAALRSLLRARLGCAAPAPNALRSRIVEGLRDTDRELRLAQGGSVGLGLNWRRVALPILWGASAAAALSIFYAVVVPQRTDRWVVGDAAEVHARALPLEISTAHLDQLMPLFERHLGFAVRPPSFQGGGYALQGGRLWHLGAHDAAYLQYGDPSHAARMSLFIVEDPGAVLHLPSARRELLGNREIFLAHAHGHNVAVWRSQDVVYSLVSDLSEDDLLSLLGRSKPDAPAALLSP